jgi:16S rRNA (cytidine1402-2'-O)-methyltransferase
MTDSKQGTLVLVGTPIGNRSDLSARAREAILGADLLLCEDTRSPLRLLGVGGEALPPRASCFVGNEHERLDMLEEALGQGKRVAFVSEAGMPVWSDPGRLLVERAWACGAQLDAVPGPTATGMALALSGFAAEGATFLGFLERSGPSRKAQLRAIAESGGAVVIYEAGNRTSGLLADLSDALGEDSPRRVLVARELTKAHQELMRGTSSQLREQISGALRGEVCVVVEGRGAKVADADADDPARAAASAVLEVMLDPKLKPRARAKALAALTGHNASELYKRLQRE